MYSFVSGNAFVIGRSRIRKKIEIKKKKNCYFFLLVTLLTAIMIGNSSILCSRYINHVAIQYSNIIRATVTMPRR